MLFFFFSPVRGGAREPHLLRAPPPQLRPLGRNFPNISTPRLKSQKEVLSQGGKKGVGAKQEAFPHPHTSPSPRHPIPPPPACPRLPPPAPRPGDSWQPRADQTQSRSIPEAWGRRDDQPGLSRALLSSCCPLVRTRRTPRLVFTPSSPHPHPPQKRTDPHLWAGGSASWQPAEKAPRGGGN